MLIDFNDTNKKHNFKFQQHKILYNKFYNKNYSLKIDQKWKQKISKDNKSGFKKN